MNDILKDQNKFSKVSLKDDTLSNFVINQQNHVDKAFKKLAESQSMTEKTRTSLKQVGTRPCVMYGSSKEHKASAVNCPPFGPILLALNTPTFKIAKFLVPILKPLTTSEFTVKDSFHFAKEILTQQHDLFMGSLNVYSLFTNIFLEKTIEICTNEPFKLSQTIEDLSLKSFCLWLLRIHIPFLMAHFINKSMVGYLFPSKPYINECFSGLPRTKLVSTLSIGI